jgi:hypothetical protein
MCYSQLFYAQTASFTADQLYRIQNVNGYADLGSANLPTITSYFDPLSGTFVTHTLYPIGPLHFYQFRTNKYGFSFEKNILSGSGKFTSPGSELSLNFSTSPIVGSSPPTITPALLIKRNLGQVGIGYSSISPINSKLDITNNSDVISTFKTTSFFTTDIQIANLFKVNRPNTKALVINNSSTAKNMFIVKGNGQTQIGEKSGNGKHLDAMLSVYGKVVARSFYVTIDPALWADYVFDPNYKLKPLKEVEEFYLIKKHLPDVPDANEISKSDLNLAEMQTIQMRKIEELTLYIVELNKQLEVLQTKIKQLENQ